MGTTRIAIACLVLFACVRRLDRFPTEAGTLAIPLTVTPKLAKLDASVRVLARSPSTGFASCSGSAGGVAMTCNITGATCDCVFTVQRSAVDGVSAITVTTDLGQGSDSVLVDSHAPVLNMDKIRIDRYGTDRPDSVHIAALAAVDPEPKYEGQAVTGFQIYETADSTQPLGTLQELGDLAVGTNSKAPKSLWVSAFDAAGNESDKREITEGRDVDPPVVDGKKFTYELNPVGEIDYVSAEDGCVSDQSAIIGFGLLSDEDVERIIAGEMEVNITEDDFLELTAQKGVTRKAIGDRQSSTVYAIAVDKAGNGSLLTPMKKVKAKLTMKGRVQYKHRQPTLSMYSEIFNGATNVPNDASQFGELFYPGADTVTSSDDGQCVPAMETKVIEPAARTFTKTSPTQSPGKRDSFAMAFDERRGTVLLFGGIKNTPDGMRPISNDLWEYDTKTHQWALVLDASVDGSAPAARANAMMTYDTVRGRIVLFGGDSVFSTCGSTDVPRCSDTWEFYGGVWHEVHTAHHPTARQSAAIAYDTLNERALMFGGLSDDPSCDGSLINNLCGGLWSYDGADWTRIETPDDLTPRYGASMAFDSMIGTMYIFGGSDNTTHCQFRHCTELWSLGKGGWNMDSANEVFAINMPMTVDTKYQKILLFGPSGSVLSDTETAAHELIVTGGNADFQRVATTGTRPVYSPSPPNLLTQLPRSGNIVGAADHHTDTWVLYDGGDLEPVRDAGTYEYVGGVIGPTASVLNGKTRVAQYFKAELDPSALLNAVSYRVRAKGRDASASPTSKVYSGIWHWVAHEWVQTWIADPAPPETFRELTTSFELGQFGNAQPAFFMHRGVVWLRVVSEESTDQPADPKASICVDNVELTLDYLLP